jgi:hypothetical protein
LLIRYRVAVLRPMEEMFRDSETQSLQERPMISQSSKEKVDVD